MSLYALRFEQFENAFDIVKSEKSLSYVEQAENIEGFIHLGGVIFLCIGIFMLCGTILVCMTNGMKAYKEQV
jgi:hypothetical protein